jgi:hypothetical protein
MTHKLDIKTTAAAVISRRNKQTTTNRTVVSQIENKVPTYLSAFLAQISEMFDVMFGGLFFFDRVMYRRIRICGIQHVSHDWIGGHFRD